LKPLHSESALSEVKLREMERLETEFIRHSLSPGSPHSPKARPDGTILDGHHRMRILRDRGVEVDALPREIVVRDV